MIASSELQPPRVDEHSVTFRLQDEDRALERARLVQDLQRPRVGPDFARLHDDAAWELLFPRPPVARIEYGFELIHKDGGIESICDPSNPKRVPGPFGDKSVIEFPEYEPPYWTKEAPRARGETKDFSISSSALRADLRATLWTAPGTDWATPLPILVVHDGLELARYSQLLVLLDSVSSEDRLPPMRAALLSPVDRNQHYSASAAYARALAHDVLPALFELCPAPHDRSMRVGMGASLGALAMLHAHRAYTASFGALFLQSGSFFRQRFDKQEQGFVRFRRVSRFVGTVMAADHWTHPIPIRMTCGNAEENLANNRAILQALRRQNYEVTLHEHPDVHNWISWRDALEPHLVDLLRKMWT